MDHRIHEVLDGMRARADITPGESDELAAMESVIDSVAGPLISAPVPNLSGRVMARVAEMKGAPSPLERVATVGRSALRWIWAPRPLTIRLRPAYAMGALGIVSGLVLLAPSATSPVPRQGLLANATEAAAPQVYVQFRLEDHGASQVALAGSFTGWRPEYELRQTAPGTWSILLPLRPGIHDYAFIVDGTEWVADPHALQIDDGFGGVNSRIALPSLPAAS
jgi:hypothetical protein